MPKIVFSVSKVDSLVCETGKQQTDYFDTKLPGFGVRVSAGGKKRYFVQCKVKGRLNDNGNPMELKFSLEPYKTKIVDGRHRPDIDHFEEMFKKADAIIHDAGNGITPEDRDRERKEAAAEKERLSKLEGEERERLRKIEEAKDLTLRTLVKDYIETKVKGKKLKESTASQYWLSLETHCGDWLDQPARNITNSMIGKRHTEITQRQSVVVKAGEKIRGGNKRVRGGKGTADATMRILRAAFNYGLAMYEDTFVRNPVAVLKAIGTWHNLGRRETSVTTDKLKSWFAGVRSIENPAMRVILEVSIFTGARKDEVQSLQWSDVNIDAETPYANFRDTKNGKELLIPLAGHVVKLLKDYKAIAFSGPDGFLFPSWGKSGHIKDPRRAIENAVKAGSAHFIPHDNRRSFLSFCNHEDLQIPVWTQKRLCNHAKPQDVTQGYVQHELKSLQQTVERVAGFILKHADIDGRTPETKGSEQAGKVVNLAERRRKKRAA